MTGATMIEVLVTLIIVAVGLFGLVGLQTRLQVAEMESYQRTQALLLLKDIKNRIEANRNAAASYVTTNLGANATCPTATTTVAQRDLREWCLAILGSGETTNAGATRHGAMIGGLGCVVSIDQDFLVTVAWQGLAPLALPHDPTNGQGCGMNQYTIPGTGTADNAYRRTATTLVRVAPL
jgi:type IV pilus assembly protein PilV